MARNGTILNVETAWFKKIIHKRSSLIAKEQRGKRYLLGQKQNQP